MSRSTDPDFFTLLTGSFAAARRQKLVPEGTDAEWLYADAPFAVLAHDSGLRSQIRLCQQLRASLLRVRLGRDHDDAVAALGRAGRIAPGGRHLLDAVARRGFMSGYRGLRVAKSGRHFTIEDGIVWELIDPNGMRHGQAATFSSWRSV